MFRLNGVDPVRAGKAWEVIPQLMLEAQAQQRYQFPRKTPIVRPQKSGIEWRVNLTQLANREGNAMDGTDARELSEAEVLGRRQIASVSGFLREVPGFENSYIVDIAPQVGIRETRRVRGLVQLTERDVLDCADFDDTIGVNGWPLELHLKGDVEFRWTQPGSRGFNQLPYRMIVPLAGAEPPQAGEAPSGGSAKRVGEPVTMDNVWVAGRCASMSHEAQSAARVTGACFVMGEAAGVAADLALKDNASAAAIDVSALQARLEDNGAYLGRSW